MGEQSAIDRLQESIEEIRKDISQMAKSIAVMEVKLENVSRDVDEMKATPKKRYDAVVSAIIATLVTAFVGYIIGVTTGAIQ